MKPGLWNREFIIITLTNFFLACSFNLLMPSIPLYITEQLNVPQTQTGIVLSSYAIALLLIRPFSGYMVDMFSRKGLLILGCVLYAASFFGYFYTTTVMLFVVVRFIHGLWWGLATVSTSTVSIDVIPSERRSEGIGYFGTFTNIAMAVAPFIAIHIYYHYNFHVLLWWAIAMAVAGVITSALIKMPFKPHVERPVLSMDRFFLVKSWPIFLNQLLPSFAWGTIGPFVAQYGLEIKIPNPGIFFVFWAGGIMLSRIFAGKMVDRGHIHRVNMLALLVISVSFVAFAIFHSSFAFCVSGLFIGIGYGMLFPATQTLYVNMAEHNKRGTANATYLLGFDLGLAIGMLAGGFITGILGFSEVYLFSGIVCALSVVIYWLVSKKIYDRNKLEGG